MDFTLYPSENERIPNTDPYIYQKDHWYNNFVQDDYHYVLIWFLYGFFSIIFIYICTMWPLFLIRKTREESLAPFKPFLKWAGFTGAIFAIVRLGALLARHF
jgi:hypothetical protein